MQIPAIGEIVWYVTGRFYAPENSSSVADYGYFLHLEGVSDPLFDGAIGETAAHLTFAAKPFPPRGATNDALAIGLDPVGEFSVYLQSVPGGNFDTPLSFARGERVATFRRIGLAVGSTLEQETGSSQKPLVGSNVFSARLIESRPFRLGSGRYDFADIVGSGVTQFGFAASAGVPTPPTGYLSAVAFTGSAIRLG
jgi:hypothetical protein